MDFRLSPEGPREQEIRKKPAARKLTHKDLPNIRNIISEMFPCRTHDPAVFQHFSAMIHSCGEDGRDSPIRSLHPMAPPIDLFVGAQEQPRVVLAESCLLLASLCQPDPSDRVYFDLGCLPAYFCRFSAQSSPL
jgi:hypothetical protein